MKTFLSPSSCFSASLALGLLLTGCAPAGGSAAPEEQVTGAAEAPDEEDTDDTGELGERYTTGFQTLDTGVDLDSFEVVDAPVLEDRSTPQSWAETAEADHAGHDHGEPELEAGGGVQRTGLNWTGGLALVDENDRTHDFGLIRAGERREHVFEFVSNGQGDLVITGVKPSCGCTRADIEVLDEAGEPQEYELRSEIPTGSRFRLVSEISTENKHGSIGATITIHSNSPGGVYNLRLAAEVEPVLDVEPGVSIFVGQITTADVREENVRISSRREEPFLLTVPDTAREGVSVTVEPENPDDEGRSNVWNGKVTIGPGLPIGVRNNPIVFRTDLPLANPKQGQSGPSAEFHTVTLSVQARVTGLVHAEPGFIGFGMVNPGQVVERRVRLECHDAYALSAEAPIEFEGMYGGPWEHADLMTATTEVSEDGKFLDILIKLQGLPETVNGSFGGVMNVAIAHPEMESISVRFSGVCRASVGGGQ